jgi:SAM-dependent methyltransferase
MRAKLRRIKQLVGGRLAAVAGKGNYCPCCDSNVLRFLPYGNPPRPNAACPLCGAKERHRLIVLYLRERTNLLDGQPKRILHIAPERPIERLFRSAPRVEYLSADLFDPLAMVKMDICNIQYPDASFDAIYCSHVLEHVPDDRRAMREFHRVLAPNGWAILQVPITAKATFEDPSVTDPADRLRIFGQADHVRRYGPDYVHRLREAGFDVKVDDYVRHLPDIAQKYGLRLDHDIFFCRKA